MRQHYQSTGYDPMRYTSRFGDNIAQAGQIIGGAFSQLPAAQRADAQYDAEQQEKQNTFNVASEYLQEIGRELRPPNAGESPQSYLMFAASQIDDAINSAQGLDRQVIQDKLYSAAARLGVKERVQESYNTQSTRNSFGAARQERQSVLENSDPMAHIGLQSEDFGNMTSSAEEQPVNYPQAPRNQFRQHIPISLSQANQEILGGMADALSMSALRLGKGVTLTEFNRELEAFEKTKNLLIKEEENAKAAAEAAALKRQQQLDDKFLDRQWKEQDADVDWVRQGNLGGRDIYRGGIRQNVVRPEDVRANHEQYGVGTGMTDKERYAARTARLKANKGGTGGDKMPWYYNVRQKLETSRAEARRAEIEKIKLMPLKERLQHMVSNNSSKRGTFDRHGEIIDRQIRIGESSGGNISEHEAARLSHILNPETFTSDFNNTSLFVDGKLNDTRGDVLSFAISMAQNGASASDIYDSVIEDTWNILGLPVDVNTPVGAVDLSENRNRADFIEFLFKNNWVRYDEDGNIDWRR